MSRAETGRHNPAAMLRAQGTPARARCGFGGYFGSGTFEDHWVCEYWDEAAPGWNQSSTRIVNTCLPIGVFIKFPSEAGAVCWLKIDAKFNT
jgi:hypothetical protein